VAVRETERTVLMVDPTPTPTGLAELVRPLALSGARLALELVSVGWKMRAVATHPPGEVVLHDLAHLGLAQELVGAQRVFDTRGGVGVAGRDQTEVLRGVGVVAQLAQTASEFGGGSE